MIFIHKHAEFSSTFGRRDSDVGVISKTCAIDLTGRGKGGGARGGGGGAEGGAGEVVGREKEGVSAEPRIGRGEGEGFRVARDRVVDKERVDGEVDLGGSTEAATGDKGESIRISTDEAIVAKKWGDAVAAAAAWGRQKQRIGGGFEAARLSPSSFDKADKENLARGTFDAEDAGLTKELQREVRDLEEKQKEAWVRMAINRAEGKRGMKGDGETRTFVNKGKNT